MATKEAVRGVEFAVANQVAAINEGKPMTFEAVNRAATTRR